MKKYISLVIALTVLFVFPGFIMASGPPIQNNSRYTTPSAPVASNGSSTETISIHLQDSDQNNVSNELITLSSSNDSTATFPQNNQTTDTNGDATFTVTSTTPGSTKITLLGSTSGVTFTDWFSISFYDAAKGCSNVPPAPVLSSVVSNTNNTATLTWIDSVNPVNNYLISYGTAVKNYIYGDTNVGGQGTTTFTVKSLQASKTYYFAVSANNNCGTSGFSNEVLVVVKPLSQTPTPTSSIKFSGSPMTTLKPSSAPVDNVTVSLDNESPTPIPVETSVKKEVDFQHLGIGIIAVGMFLISCALFYQFIKNKKEVPTRLDDPLIPEEPYD